MSLVTRIFVIFHLAPIRFGWNGWVHSRTKEQKLVVYALMTYKEWDDCENLSSDSPQVIVFHMTSQVCQVVLWHSNLPFAWLVFPVFVYSAHILLLSLKTALRTYVVALWWTSQMRKNTASIDKRTHSYAEACTRVSSNSDWRSTVAF